MARFDSTDATQAKLITAAGKQVLQCYESLYMDIDDGVFITNAPGNVTIADGIGSGTDVEIGSFLMFKGRIDSPVIKENTNETTTLAATCSSHWVDYERDKGIITNDNRQKDLYSGDKGFEFAKEVIKDVQWKT